MDDEELNEMYAEWKSEVLKELRPLIVKSLEPHKLYTYLRASEVLDSDDQEDIEAERTRKRKSERLLDIIKNRGPEGFDHFCEAIRQNFTQLFIVRQILDKFQEKKDNFSEPLAEQNLPSHSDNELPVPGSHGGPIVPCYEMLEESIAAADDSRQDRRPRSPPPAYTEY